MMTPVDWDDLEHWGKPGHNVHEASDCPDGHTTTEDAAERGRG